MRCLACRGPLIIQSHAALGHSDEDGLRPLVIGLEAVADGGQQRNDARLATQPGGFVAYPLQFACQAVLAAGTDRTGALGEMPGEQFMGGHQLMKGRDGLHLYRLPWPPSR